jgi:hypothetical protein
MLLLLHSLNGCYHVLSWPYTFLSISPFRHGRKSLVLLILNGIQYNFIRFQDSSFCQLFNCNACTHCNKMISARTALFWTITHRVVATSHRRIGTTCRVSSSRVMNMGSCLTLGFLRPTGCLETSVMNYHYSLSNSPRKSAVLTDVATEDWNHPKNLEVRLTLRHRTIPLRHAILNNDIYSDSHEMAWDSKLSKRRTLKLRTSEV